MNEREPFMRRIWKSTTFIVTFSVVALFGIIGSATTFTEHYSLFKLMLEFMVSLIPALILGLIAYTIASLISRAMSKQ
jgi:hypothetical protein